MMRKWRWPKYKIAKENEHSCQVFRRKYLRWDLISWSPSYSEARRVINRDIARRKTKVSYFDKKGYQL